MSRGRFCPVAITRSDAIPAELLLGVGELARVLHQEARLAHELARRTRPDLAAVALVLGVDRLVLVLFVLVLNDDEPVLEDRVEVGLDVVGIGLLLVLVLLGILGGRGCLGRGLVVLLEILDDLVVDEVLLEILLEVGLVEILVVEVLLREVLFDLFLFELFYVVVGHACPWGAALMSVPGNRGGALAIPVPDFDATFSSKGETARPLGPPDGVGYWARRVTPTPPARVAPGARRAVKRTRSARAMPEPHARRRTCPGGARSSGRTWGPGSSSRVP